MRVALRLLGYEVLAVEVDTAGGEEPGDESLAPPFGFSGSGNGQVERADTWTLEDPAPGDQAVKR